MFLFSLSLFLTAVSPLIHFTQTNISLFEKFVSADFRENPECRQTKLPAVLMTSRIFIQDSYTWIS